MKLLAVYSLSALTCMTGTEAKKDPNTLVTKQSNSNAGIIWSDDGNKCLMMKNKYINRRLKKGKNKVGRWNTLKQKGKNVGSKLVLNPTCEETEVIWTSYCADAMALNDYDTDAEFLSQDLYGQAALFRVSVHENMNNVFCIIPEGDYCTKEEPGTYKLQKETKFVFRPFDGVNPDYYFDFNDQNQLTYGHYANDSWDPVLFWAKGKKKFRGVLQTEYYTSNQNSGKFDPIVFIPPVSQKFTLSNPRFADGLYYTHNWGNGVFPNVPALAIDGEIPFYTADVPDSERLDKFACSSSGDDEQFLVDLPTYDTSAVNIVTIYPRDTVWEPQFERYQTMIVEIGDGGMQAPCDPLQGLDADTVKASVATGLKWDCHGATGESIIVTNQDWLQIVEIEAEGLAL